MFIFALKLEIELAGRRVEKQKVNHDFTINMKIC